MPGKGGNWGREMSGICFVILHYNVLEDTENCIESIRRLKGQNQIRIAVVDNASPNGSGKVLAERYARDEQICVLCRTENDGFSRGNNAGCRFAVERWNPDFVVVANNDVLFVQEDFALKVREIYEEEGFAVLGPDIYAPLAEVHQSPISDAPPGRKTVRRTIFLNRMALMLFPFCYPLLKYYYGRLTVKAGTAYDSRRVNVCPMGACLIFSREYLKERDKVFEPETRFYYEENIMMRWCLAHQKKVLYDPLLQVHHMEGRATGTVDVNERETIRFRMKNIVEAAGVYLAMCQLH